MARINDDEDVRGAGEDGKDANGVPADDDGDLAVDEDPANAVRVKLQDLQFPFIGGGSQKSYIERNLADLLERKLMNRMLILVILMKKENGVF